MTETLVHLPTLPDTYSWQLGLDRKADYEIRVYKRAPDGFYDSYEDLILEESVPNEYSGSEQKLQNKIDDIAARITRGAALINGVTHDGDNTGV